MSIKPLESYSPVIVGCMRLGQWGAGLNSKQYEYFIDGCLELGLDDFDHADLYGGYTTENEFGEVLKRRKELKSKIKITTKCNIKMPSDALPDIKIKHYDSSPESIINSVDKSLANLGIDNIELLLLHRPDILLDVKSVAECFYDLKKTGKVKYFGVSNFLPEQFEMLNAHYPLSNNQIELSLLHYEAFINGTINQCQMLGVKPTAWSPLGGGKLFNASEDAQCKRIKSVSTKLQKKYHCNFMQLMLAWLGKHPAHIVPVIGSTQLTRIENAIGAMKLNLTNEDWYALLEASRGYEVA